MIILDPVEVTDAILTSTNVPENDYAAYSATGVWGPGERVIVIGADIHDIYQQLLGTTSVVTMTAASPCVVSHVGHGFAANQPVKLTTTGALYTGLAAGTTCYVKSPAADTYNLSTTPGGAAINTSGVQSGVHTLTANAIGHSPATSPLYWVLVGVTNARKMFDAINNTRTENPESIVFTLTLSQLAGGLYLGGLDADEIQVAVTDAEEGLVYSLTESLIISTSGSSFFGWAFNPIRRKNYFLALDLPMYVDPAVQVSIIKLGSVAKCGMCSIGRLTRVGFTAYGMGREDKDYSSTRFDVDGLSETTRRGYSKILTLDTVIKNDVIDSTIDILSDFRARNVVFIGSNLYGHSVVYGKYVSFKNIVPDLRTSRMSLKIDGVI